MELKPITRLLGKIGLSNSTARRNTALLRAKKIQHFTTKVNGVPFTVIGDRLRESEHKNLVESMNNLSNKYPSIHQSLQHVLIENRNFGRNQAPRTGISLLDSLSEGKGAAGLYRFGDSTMSIFAGDRIHFKDPIKADRIVASVYAHEFGHHIQNALRQKSIPISILNSAIESHFPGIRRITGELDPNETIRQLGSAYASHESNYELFPELLMAHHFPEMTERFVLRDGRLSNSNVRKATNSVDELIRFSGHIANPDPETRITTSARHGARPRSRSAMGGLAYLQ